MAYKITDKQGRDVKYQNKNLVGMDITNVLVKDVSMQDRTLMLIGTDETRDREGDIITYTGWKFENFYKNPVFLWAHDYSSVPLARVERIYKRPKQKRYDFLMKFPTQGINPFADLILNLYYERIINASSVGFIPTKKEKIDEDNDQYWGNNRFLEKELLELSGCPVPCNPNAVQEMNQFLDQKVYSGVKAKDIWEEYRKGNIPGLKVDDLREELHLGEFRIIDPEPKIYKIEVDSGFDTFVVEETENEPEQGENKKVGGARNLTIADEATAWNAAAAIKRVQRMTSSDNSGDKEKINWVQYRKVFAWYDTADTESFGAYKLPFADVVGGSMKAIWKGVAAAMAALLGARGGVDIPDGDRKAVYNFLSVYYEKFDKEPPEFKTVENDNNNQVQGQEISTMKPDEIKIYIEEAINKVLESNNNSKTGAVLNKKNLQLLSDAITAIQQVIDSAKKEEETSEEDDDKSAEPQASSDSIYTNILKVKLPNEDIKIVPDKSREQYKELTAEIKKLNEMIKSI